MTLETPRTLGDLDQDAEHAPFRVGDLVTITVNGYTTTDAPVIDRNERHLVLYDAASTERWFLAWDMIATSLTVTTPPPAEPDPGE